MRQHIILSVLILALAGAVLGQAEDKVLNLTIDECIEKTLKNNLALAVQVLNPELSDISVSLSKEKFFPSLSFNYNQRDTNSASYSWLEAADIVSQLRGDYSAQITQVLPTGGNLGVSLTGYKLDSNSKFQTINPRYSSTLMFNFSQPLLRDFGPKMARREIIVAQNNYDISALQFDKFLQDKILEAEQAYWNLSYAIDNLKVRQQSLKLAQELVAKNRRAVEIGTLAPLEVLTAEADVASREADILDAEALVKNSEDTLKQVINLGAEMPDERLVRIVPTSQPAFEPQDVNVDQTLPVALQNRPDLAATKLDIQNKELTLSFSRNQLLPDLSLDLQYWSPGVSGTRLEYENNDPLRGVIVRKIPGGAVDSLKDSFGFKYKNWSVGLTLSIPLSSVFSRAQAAQAKVGLDQALLKLKDQEQQLLLEISNAVRAVQTNYKRVQAYKAARELAQRRLEAEEEKLKVGLSTNYFVLQYQRDLANQQSMELKASIDYSLSLAKLEAAQGLSLQNRNIKVSRWLGE